MLSPRTIQFFILKLIIKLKTSSYPFHYLFFDFFLGVACLRIWLRDKYEYFFFESQKWARERVESPSPSSCHCQNPQPIPITIPIANPHRSKANANAEVFNVFVCPCQFHGLASAIFWSSMLSSGAMELQCHGALDCWLFHLGLVKSVLYANH